MTSESIFCRAFAAIGLGERAHQTLIATHLGKEVIWHAATDATAIVAREKVVKEPQTEPAGETPADDVSRRMRGLPRKSHDPPPPDPTKLQRHLAGTLAANLQDMPDVRCNHGCKTNSQENTDDWRGYKLYLVTGDRDIPYYFCLIASFWAQRSVI